MAQYQPLVYAMCPRTGQKVDPCQICLASWEGKCAEKLYCPVKMKYEEMAKKIERDQQIGNIFGQRG